VAALISVLMPAYDGEAFVAEALDSALRQHGVELEVLVTDDGSRDATAALVAEIAAGDPRVRFEAQDHGGIAAARNACLARARGTHVALLDQDDRWPAGKLARQLAWLDGDAGPAGVFGRTEMFGPDHDGAAVSGDDDGYTMLLSAGLLRRSAVDAVGEFDPAYASADDLDFLLRLLEDGHRIELEPEVGVLHRRHPAQTTTDRAATRQECVRALARSLARRRRLGLTGPLVHPLVRSSV
jgi:glycosyltransferase involved in cell wall biosynthesis